MIKIEKRGYFDPFHHKFLVTSYVVKLFGKVVFEKAA